MNTETKSDPSARRVALIEDKLDPQKLAEIALGSAPGDTVGVKFQSMFEMMEFAKMMAISDLAVPPHLRGNAGACLAIVIRAHEVNMSPFFLANASYKTVNKGVERIAFESSVFHAIINARAPIIGLVEHEIVGEGDDRYCRAWATLRATGKVVEFKGETLGKLRPARNDFGQVRGSPLWDRKPEVQLVYDAVRDLARTNFPHVLAGLPTIDDMLDAGAQHVGPDNAKDVTVAATLGQRLRARQAEPAAPREGFSDRTIHAHIDAAVAAATLKQDEPIEPTETKPKRGAKQTIVEAAPERDTASAPAADPHKEQEGEQKGESKHEREDRTNQDARRS